MALSRVIAVVAALSTAVLLAGCGGSDTPSDSGSAGAAATPTPTQDAAVTWADGVCSASTALQQSVQQVGGALQRDSSDSATVRAKVRDTVTAVQQSAASLKTALTAVPPGADPQLTAAQQQLQTASERAQTAVDQLGEAADQVKDAKTPSQVATGLATVKAALSSTAADLGTYVDSLRGTVESRDQAVQDAFGVAPACTNVGSSPSPSA